MIAARVHLFPFRTQKLSSFAPKILCGRLHGKIGNANIPEGGNSCPLFLIGIYFPLPEAGENMARYSYPKERAKSIKEVYMKRICIDFWTLAGLLLSGAAAVVMVTIGAWVSIKHFLLRKNKEI